MSDQQPEAFAEPGEQGANEERRTDHVPQLVYDIGRRRAAYARVGKARALLEHPVIRDDLTRRRLRRQQTAERFNVFDALSIDRREIYHSRFLAHLLDSRQSHDQNAVFLKAVIGAIGRKRHGGETAEWVGSLDYTSCRVTPEQHAEEYGRIDLVLEFRCGTRIAIENKVDHVEGERQLPRYRKWLDKRGANRGQQVLVFLTPDGRKSVENCGEYVRLSYRDLAEALAEAGSKCSSTAVPLLSTLQQYIQLCRRLAEGGNEVADQSKEILELLRAPEKLAVALDIEGHLLAIKDEVKKTFRKRVFDLLEARLGDDKIWTAKQKGNNWEAYVGIRTRDDQGWDHPSSNYWCGVVLLFDKVEGGWHRPAHIDLKSRPADDDSRNIEACMSNEKWGTPDGLWVCKTSQIHDIPHLVWSDPEEDIVEIHRDNLGEGSLAERVANWIWERFKTYHGDIEKLESFNRARRQGR